MKSRARIARRLRPLIEHLPAAADAYRSMRHIWRSSQLQVFDVPQGFRMVGDLAFRTGSYEPAETLFLTTELGECDVFVDVGANVGFFSCLARSHAKRVVAFEPLSSNLDLLYRNLALNRWLDVEVFPVALGARPAVTELFGEATGASLLPGWADSSPGHKRFVAVSTLDITVGTRFAGERLLVKVDVEGWELPVLRGAEKLLDRSPSPVWLVENALGVHAPVGQRVAPFTEVFELFRRRGYRAHPVGRPEAAIDAAQVERWALAGRTDGGVYNFVFRR